MGCSKGKQVTIQPINAEFCAVTSWQWFLFTCLEKLMSVRKTICCLLHNKMIEGLKPYLGPTRCLFKYLRNLIKKRKGNNWNTPRSEIISYSATEGVWLLWCQAMKYIYQRRFFSLTKINLLLTRFVCERKKWCMFLFFFFFNFYFAHCIYILRTTAFVIPVMLKVCLVCTREYIC